MSRQLLYKTPRMKKDSRQKGHPKRDKGEGSSGEVRDYRMRVWRFFWMIMSWTESMVAFNSVVSVALV